MQFLFFIHIDHNIFIKYFTINRFRLIQILFLPVTVLAQTEFPIKLKFDDLCNTYTCIAEDFQPELILDHIQNAPIKDSTFLACCYHQVAAFYFNDGNDNLAIFYNLKAEKLRKEFDDGLLWKTYLNLGKSYNYLRKSKTAIAYLTKAKNDLSQSKNKFDEIKILNELGEGYLEIGEFEKAIQSVNNAIAINKSDTNVEQLAISHNLLAAIYLRIKDSGNIHLAIAHSDTAYNLGVKNEDFEIILNEINNKANAYNVIGRYKDAQKLFDNALYNLNGKENSFDFIKATLLNNFATVLAEQENYALAIRKLFESLVLFEQYFEEDFHYYYAGNYENLGDCFVGLGNNYESLKNYQKALINLTDNFKDENIFKNPNFTDGLYVYSNLDIIRVLHLKANVAFKYYTECQDKSYLDLAQYTYQCLLDFHNQLQKEIPTENSKLFQADQVLPYLENALKVSYEQSMLDTENDFNATFQFIEKNKSTILLEAINESNALKYAGIPDNLIENEKELKLFIIEYKTQLNSAQQDSLQSQIKEFEHLITEKERDLQALNKNSKFRKYYEMKYEQNNVNLSHVQNQLDSTTALLEYFVGDSMIYVLTIQKEQVNFHQIKKPVNWEKDVGDFLDNIIYKQHDRKYTRQAHSFYQLLVEEPMACLNTDIKYIQIIPDAEINKIPFGALLSEVYDIPKDSTVNFSDLYYLADTFTISYAYSSKLFLEAIKEKDQLNSIGEYVVFLAEDSAKINQYCDQHISNISTSSNSKFYMIEDCNKENFKAFANKYSIINLTMHGCGKKGALTFNDGDLTDAEIYNLDLSNNQLIYLTACETNVGILQKGEGVMSLSRAFTYAGCPALVSTLWSVHPESTCVITELFFENLKNGKPIDEALREAQKVYIDNYVKSTDKIDKNISAHPFYWAGIIPIGKMDAIEFW